MDKNLKELRIKFMMDVSIIPFFLDTKVENSDVSWKNIQYIIRMISKLSVGKVLKDDMIMKYYQNIEETFDILLDINTEEFAFELGYYIDILLENYVDFCVERELFEQADNLNRLKNMIKQYQ